MIDRTEETVVEELEFLNPGIFERENIVMLDSLADDLMVENIKEQINQPIVLSINPVNYLDKFDSRYNFLINKYKDNPELVRNLNDVKEKFYFQVNNEIGNKLDIRINTDSGIDSMLIKCLYEFFILNMRENLITFLFNLITKNKKSLVAEYEDNRKSIEYVALKKVLKNKIDIVILSNIYDIVTHLVEPEYDYKDILSIIVDEDPNEKNNYMISQLLIKEEMINAIEVGNEFSIRLLYALKKKESELNQIVVTLQSLLYESFIKKD